ncbi:MAG: cupin domain-containing protein [Pseudomonas sp.]|nr:cupin domain-containing protein [Pseudomonas sp.]
MHPRAVELIDLLQLQAHPEGGYYRRLYESSECLPSGRLLASAIVFLLPAGQLSRWHRVDADELWHFYEGAPLELLIADTPAAIERQLLGPVAADQLPQRLVRAQAWQAARTQGDFSLVGCTLAPGFEFAGFALLADEPQVQRDWPLLAGQYPELV